MDWYIVYAKLDGCKTFGVFDINEGRFVGNLIFVSLLARLQKKPGDWNIKST